MYSKEQPQSVVTLFGRVAPSYDLTNIALSMGLCQLWLRKLVKQLRGSKKLGDLCGGTGAVTVSFLKKNPGSKAIVYDFCPEMLSIAEKRLVHYPGRGEIQCGDCHQLPYDDHSFDTLSMAYGLRNLQEPRKALKECLRVLEPKGQLFILELTRPKSSLLYGLHKFYLKLFVPLIGKVMTKDKEAYCYLAKSVAHFSPPETIGAMLSEVGFENVHYKRLSFGIATLFSCQKIKV